MENITQEKYNEIYDIGNSIQEQIIQNTCENKTSNLTKEDSLIFL